MKAVSFLIEGASFSRHSAEDLLVLQYAAERNIPVAYASARQVMSGRVQVAPGHVPVGGIPFVRAVAQRFGIADLEQSCYPLALRPFLHRTLRTESLRTVLGQIEAGGPAVFIKPAERTKRFTGFVLDNSQDYRIAGVSRALPVWVSNPVRWLAEWRVYVVRHEVRHLSLYAGSRAAPFDHEVLDHMVKRYAAAGGPGGYALDIGVLEGPAGPLTALVEVNDGFAVGAYENTSASVYSEMLEEFWLWVGQGQPRT